MLTMLTVAGPRAASSSTKVTSTPTSPISTSPSTTAPPWSRSSCRLADPKVLFIIATLRSIA